MKLYSFPLILISSTIAFANEPAKIVVDTPITYQIVSSVAAFENAQIEIFLEPSQSAHHLSLKPSQAKMIANADYIFGIHENYITVYTEAVNRLASENAKIAFGGIEEDDHDHEGDEHDDHGEENHNSHEGEHHEGKHDHHGEDYHIWFSPVELANMFTTFSAQANTQSADPNALEKFQASIAITDAQAQSLQGLKSAIIASHDAFGIFEEHYDIQSQGAFHDGFDQDVSLREFEGILKAINAGEINCVLMETSEHAHDLEDLAKIHELTIYEFDILGWDKMGEEDFFQSYFDAIAKIYIDCAF